MIHDSYISLKRLNSPKSDLLQHICLIQTLMFAPLDVHCYRKWFPSNSVEWSRNGNGNR